MFSCSYICSFCGEFSIGGSNTATNIVQKYQQFNGFDDQLIEGKDVLVEGKLIKSVGTDLAVSADVEVIDGEGRTLMPGLIEGHAHLMLMGPSLPAMEANTT